MLEPGTAGASPGCLGPLPQHTGRPPLRSSQTGRVSSPLEMLGALGDDERAMMNHEDVTRRTEEGLLRGGSDSTDLGGLHDAKDGRGRGGLWGEQLRQQTDAARRKRRRSLRSVTAPVLRPRPRWHF